MHSPSQDCPKTATEFNPQRAWDEVYGTKVPTQALTPEQVEVLGFFLDMLRSVTADGGRKREAGLKLSWKIDTSHEAGLFSHLNAWKHGVEADRDSGAHPLIHAAWRCLAIAWQEQVGGLKESDAVRT